MPEQHTYQFNSAKRYPALLLWMKAPSQIGTKPVQETRIGVR
jgi:hypothetical protein